MTFFELPVRILAVLLIGGRFIYWTVAELKAHKDKPKIEEVTLFILARRLVITVLNLFLYFQLFGFDVYPYENSFSNLLLGCSLIVFATIISILARRELGTNWAHASEYQIKKRHELVKTGIYAYIDIRFI